MMRSKSIVVAIAFFSSFFIANAQDEVSPCGHYHAEEAFFEAFPEAVQQAKQAAKELEERAETFTKSRSGGGEVYIVPVVFHIIHNNGEENITQAQVQGAVDLLNRDARKQNPDTVFIINEFKDIAADIEIEFRLAQKDPQGNCSNGITRTQSLLTYEGDQSMKNLINWPRDSYLNIWVCNDIASGAAGYSLYPSSVSGPFGDGVDGIVLRHDYVGSNGTSNVGRGRALLHEVGHWINLPHLWGNSNNPAVASNCSTDDGVSDTPLTLGWTSCETFGESCGSLDNVQNFMEYSGCRLMLTEGQKARMRAALTSSIANRNQLWTTNNLIETGVMGDPQLCVADMIVSDKVVCQGEFISFTDNSYNQVDFWTWDLGDGTTLSGDNEEDLTQIFHSYDNPGVYDVVLSVSLNGEVLTASETINVLAPVALEGELQEGFEGNWDQQLLDLEWEIRNDQQDLTWERTDEASSDGDNSLWINNRNVEAESARDDLVSQRYDLTGFNSLAISFDWAFAQKFQGTNDKLLVYGTGNCEDDLELLFFENDEDLATANPTNSNWEPDADEWQTHSMVVTDSVLFQDGFKLIFRFIGEGGNNFFLDNINITPSFVSVEEADPLAAIGVYPNPAQDRLTLTGISSQSRLNAIMILDANGRTIQQVAPNQAGQEQTLDISRLAKGLYFVQFWTSEGSRSLRFVKE